MAASLSSPRAECYDSRGVGSSRAARGIVGAIRARPNGFCAIYKPPHIESGAGAAKQLRTLPGRVLAVTMDVPWQLLQAQAAWQPDHVHEVTDMDRATVEALPEALQAEVLEFVDHVAGRAGQVQPTEDDAGWAAFSVSAAMRGLEDEPSPYSTADLKDAF